MTNSRSRNTHSRSVQLVLGCVLLIAALWLSACGNQLAQTNPTQVKVLPTPTATPTGRGVGDTLRMLHPQAPTILNPHLATALKDWEPARITLEPLASFDKDANLIPVLAAEVPTLDNGDLAADRKSVIWKLKPNVKWSDGQDFTADDVIFTWKFATNPDIKASSAGLFNVIQSIDKIDPHTIKINFKNANPAWALPFTGVQGVVLPQHVFEPFNNANARQAPANTLPVGTGPYRVVAPGIKPQEVLLLGSQLVETNKIVFEPNPYYRETDKPFFSKVEYRGGGTPNEAARSVLQEGSEDYAYQLGQLTPDDLSALQATQGRLVISFGSAVERILLNRTDPNKQTPDGEASNMQYPHPFFSDIRVRQAFAYAINRQAMAAGYGSAGRPTTNVLVAPPQYLSPNTFYDFNLDKAKELLDEAGWRDTNGDGFREKDGVRLKVVFQGKVSATVQQNQQIVRDALQSIGVEVVLKITDSAIMFGPGAANPDSSARFNADMQEKSIQSPGPDPSAFMKYWSCSQIPQKANNWAGLNTERWCSPEYEALMKQADAELDPEKRRQLFIQMNDMIVQDVVMIPIINVADAQGASLTLQGVDLTPWDMNTWNIEDWRRVSQ